MDVVKIIENISAIMQYFVPGYLFLIIFRFVTYDSRKQEIQITILASVVLSYLFVNVGLFIVSRWDGLLINVQLITVAIAVVMALILGLLFTKAQWFEKLIERFFGRSMEEENAMVELWRSHLRTKKSALCVKFTLVNNPLVYEGQIARIASAGSEPVIYFEYYVSYDPQKGPNQLICNHLEDRETYFCVRYADIKSFEYREQ